MIPTPSASARHRRPALTILLGLFATLALAGCGNGDDPVTVALGPLAGRIEDGFGDPVAHASIRAWPLFDTARGFAAPLAAETAADGSFDLGQQVAGSWVIAAGFGTDLAAADTVTVPAGAAALVLVPAAGIRGHVRLANLPGAGGVRVSSLAPASSAVSEEDGSWRLLGLPPGRWPVRYSMDGFRDSVVATDPAAPGDTLDVGEVVLQPSGAPAPR